MERLRTALSSKLAEGLTAEERGALQSALASAAQEIHRLEKELRSLSQRGGSK